jgi:hypothetical protein
MAGPPDRGPVDGCGRLLDRFPPCDSPMRSLRIPRQNAPTSLPKVSFESAWGTTLETFDSRRGDADPNEPTGMGGESGLEDRAANQGIRFDRQRAPRFWDNAWRDLIGNQGDRNELFRKFA